MLFMVGKQLKQLLSWYSFFGVALEAEGHDLPCEGVEVLRDER